MEATVVGALLQTPAVIYTRTGPDMCYRRSVIRVNPLGPINFLRACVCVCVCVTVDGHEQTDRFLQQLGEFAGEHGMGAAALRNLMKSVLLVPQGETHAHVVGAHTHTLTHTKEIFICFLLFFLLCCGGFFQEA